MGHELLHRVESDHRSLSISSGAQNVCRNAVVACAKKLGYLMLEYFRLDGSVLKPFGTLCNWSKAKTSLLTFTTLQAARRKFPATDPGFLLQPLLRYLPLCRYQPSDRT